MTVQITIVKIDGYGPWTLTLGSDREASLQMLQAKVYYEIQRLFSIQNCLAFYNRFDEYFIATNGLSILDHKSILDDLSILFKNIRFSFSIGVGSTFMEANKDAYNSRKLNMVYDNDHNIFFNSKNSNLTHRYDTEFQIIHIDIDGSNKITLNFTPYDVTSLVMKIHTKLISEFLKINALTFYLGGDNFMILSHLIDKSKIQNIINKISGEMNIIFNCGIGIGTNAKNVVSCATEALDTIRQMRKAGDIIHIFELKCH